MEAEMQTTTMQWDLQTITPEPSTGEKLFALYLLIVGVTASVKLARVWRAAPPFRAAPLAGPPSYLRLLRESALSIQRWIGLTFLVWGFFATMNLMRLLRGLMAEKSIGSWEVFRIILQFGSTLCWALVAISYLYLIRWHMLKRCERISE
jgi:hypothetical protein